MRCVCKNKYTIKLLRMERCVIIVGPITHWIEVLKDYREMRAFMISSAILVCALLLAVYFSERITKRTFDSCDQIIDQMSYSELYSCSKRYPINPLIKVVEGK
jgi:hypothetical protein